MNKICPICGKDEHRDKAVFCDSCGATLVDTEEEHTKKVKESVRRFVNGEIEAREHLKVLFGSKTFEFYESGVVRL